MNRPQRHWALVLALSVAAPMAAQDLAPQCNADSTKSGAGLLVGFVRNATDGRALVGATVSAEWRAIALDPGNFRVVTQRALALVGADGSYRLCGLPVDAPLTFRVAAAGHIAIAGPVVVPVTGAARQDVRLADSSVVNGAAGLRGRVVHENAKPVTSGRAVMPALARDVPVQNGAFFLPDLPQGTWVVEVRAIGLEPRSVWLDVTESGIGAATITMGNRAQPLDAVTVIGAPSRNTRILEEVLRRQRSSFGTVFLPGNSWLQGALHASDVLRAARGFRYVSPTWIYARGGCRAINVYVNGEFFPGGLEELDHVAPARDVLAIEAYPDVAFAPIQWRNNVGQMKANGKPGQVCAVVAVWTSR